jgi:hypothetical protein
MGVGATRASTAKALAKSLEGKANVVRLPADKRFGADAYQLGVFSQATQLAAAQIFIHIERNYL